MAALDNLLNQLRDLSHKASDAIRDNREIAIGVGASVAVLGAWRLLSGSSKYKRKPSTFGLSGGSIDRKKIDHTFNDYSASYGKEAGAGITDRARTTELVSHRRFLNRRTYQIDLQISFQVEVYFHRSAAPSIRIVD